MVNQLGDVDDLFKCQVLNVMWVEPDVGLRALRTDERIAFFPNANG